MSFRSFLASPYGGGGPPKRAREGKKEENPLSHTHRACQLSQRESQGGCAAYYPKRQFIVIIHTFGFERKKLSRSFESDSIIFLEMVGFSYIKGKAVVYK